MIKIIICDDNRGDRQKYREELLYLADKYDKDVEIKEYESGSSLLIDVETRRFQADVVYLDICMPFADGLTMINGMDVAKKLREYGCVCEIVFLSISASYLLSAFDVGAFNYIIKGDERFEDIFCKVMERVEAKKQEYMSFTANGENRILRLADIRYFEVYQRIVTVNYGESGKFEFMSSLDNLEHQLAGWGFRRVHRSFLVSLEHIEVLTYGELQLRDKTIIPVSRSRYQEVKEAMQERYGIEDMVEGNCSTK